jgi:hypothetical protein
MGQIVTGKDISTLDAFLESHHIDYVLTGTSGLFYHGFLPKETETHDIDIIIVPHNDEQREEIMTLLKEQEQLSGCQYDNEHYDQRVYIFKIGENNVKVNAFEGSHADIEASRAMVINGIAIRVHSVMHILQAKLAMKRSKDYEFYNKIVYQLSSMFFHNV